ncbi:enoyl-CoA-hydratase DpgB [Nocardiopsis baichengensis]|uniref:enoyl-CoA-hydratase DpgB n=1 Tax=Nocardiopsis baichengensis TaxID=280240 RepID=UPI000348D0BC|nr:enoyl-CoA-hydratase DpgB [Nocardiopsis baichengensis]
MNARSDMHEIDEEFEFTLEVDGTRPLAELTAALNGVCDRVEEASGPAVVVLWPGPTSPDGRSWPGKVEIREVGRWEKAVRRLERLDAVVIGVIRGTCGGPALDLLLASDYRIGSTDMRLLMPVNEGQFWPGMAVHRLVHQVGAARTRQLVLWADGITADRAGELGLVDDVAAQVADSVRAAALLLGRIAGPELAVRRQLLMEAPTTGFEEALGAHLAACDRELRRLGGAEPEGARP